MRRVKVPGLDIHIPPGSAFKIEPPPMMPKMHLLAASAQNSIPKALRGNLTLLLLGKTKSERELLEIAEEFGSEIGVPQFLELYKQATDEPHSFLMIDLHPKSEHPSPFRKNLAEFIVP